MIPNIKDKITNPESSLSQFSDFFSEFAKVARHPVEAARNTLLEAQNAIKDFLEAIDFNQA